MVTKTLEMAIKESAPPVLIASATFMGVSFQNWVYLLTAIYTVIQIFRLLPKIIGCGRCFYSNGTCTLVCRKPDKELI